MNNYRSAGTTQSERIASYGTITPVEIDNTTQTDFLNFISDFSSLLKYWNGQGNIDGDWQPFFQTDTSFILADISRFDLSPYQKRGHSLKRRFLSAKKVRDRETALIDLYIQVLELGQTIGIWFNRLSSATNTNRNICDSLLSITHANLDQNLRNLVAIFNNLANVTDTSPNALAKKDISYETSLTANLVIPLVHEANDVSIYPGNGQDSSLFSFWQCYYKIFTSLLSSSSQLLAKVPINLSTSLQTPSHSPQCSLLLAFYNMLQPAKATLNNLSAEHQKFYFEKILQQKPETYTPDQTFLTFQSKQGSDLVIPKGTLFEAGTNSSTGDLIIYSSDKECPVTQARPSTYKAIYNGTTSSSLTKAIQGKILSSPVADSKDGQGKKITSSPASWATFSQPSKDLSLPEPASSTLGFAIASPSFLISDGDRTIRLSVWTSANDLLTLSNEAKTLQWPPLQSSTKSYPELIQWQTTFLELELLEKALTELYTYQSHKKKEPSTKKKKPLPRKKTNKTLPKLNWETKQNFLLGLDLSSYNTKINYPEIVVDELDFAFIRATKNSEPDRSYHTNSKALRYNSLTLGAYHTFNLHSSSTEADVKQQAENDAHAFLSIIGTISDTDLPPTIAIDTPGITETLTTYISTWINIVQNTTQRYPIVLTNTDFLSQHDSYKELKHLPLWLKAPGASSTPKDELWQGKWAFWQYSRHARIKGVTQKRNTDLNMFNGNHADLKDFIKKTIIPPSPQLKTKHENSDKKNARIANDTKTKPDLAKNERKTNISPNDKQNSIFSKFKKLFSSKQKRNPTLTTDPHTNTHQEISLQNTLHQEATNPKPQTISISSLDKLLKLIYQLETQFREDFQSCAKEINKIAHRSPVPLNEWLNTSLSLINFKARYILISKRHQSIKIGEEQSHQINSTFNQVDKKVKDIGDGLINNLKKHQKAIENAGLTVAKDAINSLLSPITSKLNSLSSIFHSIDPSKPKQTAKIGTKASSYFSSIFNHLSNHSPQNTQTSTNLNQLSELLSSPQISSASEIQNILTATIAENEKKLQAFISLEWLENIEALIKQSEEQLVNAAKKQLLIAPSDLLKENLSKLREKAKRHETQNNTSNQKNADTEHAIVQRTIDQDSMNAAKEILEMAHKGWSLVEHLWDATTHKITDYAEQKIKEAEEIIEHPFQTLLDHTIKKVDSSDQALTTRAQDKINGFQENLINLKGSLTKSANDLKTSAAHAIDKQRLITNTLDLHKRSLADSIDKITHLSTIQKLIEGQKEKKQDVKPVKQSNLKTQKRAEPLLDATHKPSHKTSTSTESKTTRSTTSDPSITKKAETAAPALVEALDDIEKRLNCWQSPDNPKTKDYLVEPDWQLVEAILGDAFSVEYSSAKQWAIPDETSCFPTYIIPEKGASSLSPSNIGLQLAISIGQTASAPSGWTTKACPGNFSTSLPIIQAILNQEATIKFKDKSQLTFNPYPLVQSLTFTKLQLWADVANSSNFTAQNQFGSLKPSKPFSLFGEKPIQGAEFYLGNTEIFSKSLDYFFSEIDWYDLPQSEVGFAERYYLYNIFGNLEVPFTNGAFLWDVDILEQGTWSSLNCQNLQPFFRTDNNSSTTSTPLFEWNDVILSLSPYISFNPKIKDIAHISHKNTQKTNPPVPPPIHLPNLPPLPKMSPLNVGPLLPSTLLIANPEHLPKQQSETTTFSPKAKWNNDTISGYLRFTLQFPQSGFGAQIYPDVLAAIANENISRMADLVAFRLLKPNSAEQTSLITTWNTELATKAQLPQSTKNATTNPNKLVTESSSSSIAPKAIKQKEHHKKIKSFLNEFAHGIEKLAGGALHIAEHLAANSGVAPLSFLGKASEDIEETLQTDANTSTDEATLNPSKLFAPLKPPPPAWVPKVKSVSLNYGSNETIKPQEKDSSSSVFYHIHPFGISTPLDEKHISSSIHLLPNYQQQGYLYIGLTNVAIPQTLNLLFKLNEATGNRRMPLANPDWSYLSKNGWKTLPHTQCQDGTSGLVKSGIVTLTIFEEGNLDSSLFAGTISQFWLRVAVTENVEATCNTINILANAVPVTYKSGADINTHFGTSLLADTIKNSVTKIEGLTKILQPIASINGISPETTPQFHTRVAERLRHKDRAISVWDYEHLILQKFKTIRACRALEHSSLASQHKNRTQPGSIVTLVFPEITPETKPLSPETDRATLLDITNFLTKRSDPFLTISAVNPTYLYIHLNAAITFKQGYDPSHYLKELNTALIVEIAPWSIANSTCNPFSVTHSYDSLLQFILTQNFVENVNQFTISIATTETSSTGTAVHETKQSTTQNITSPDPFTIFSSVTKHHLIATSGQPVQTHQLLEDEITQPGKKQTQTLLNNSGNTIFIGGAN